jgi:anti-sigma B factor antagonist
MVKINIVEQDGYKVAILDGRLDTPATPEAEEALSPLFHCDDKDIILDCTELSYIASSGLRLFLEILKNSKAHDHHVYIKNISKNIKEAFVLTGFIDLFEYM